MAPKRQGIGLELFADMAEDLNGPDDSPDDLPRWRRFGPFVLAIVFAGALGLLIYLAGHDSAQRARAIGPGLVVAAIGAWWFARAGRDTRRLGAATRQRMGQLHAANAALHREMDDRLQAEHSLHQRETADALARLAGSIAHELNNMLAVVIGGIDVARRRIAQEPASAAAPLDDAMDGARRAAVLIERLLAFARAEPVRPARIDIDALIAGMASGGPDAAARASEPLAILVVEDDPRVMRSTLGALAALGHTGLACDQPAEAAARLAQRPDIALILSDILMPGMSGPQMIEALGDAVAQRPVIFVTGFAGDQAEAAQRTGFPILRKPFTVMQLAAAIDDAMARQRGGRPTSPAI